jgi:hypothetical protein
MRKRVAAVVLLILTGGITAPATCTGWESSASDRMACCQRAQHEDCTEQSAADDCCAQEEQSRQIGSTVSPAAQVTAIKASLSGSPAYLDSFSGLQRAPRLVSALAAAYSPPPPTLSPPLRI